jgi:hypothetical protein
MNWGAGEWGVGIMNYELGRGEKGAGERRAFVSKFRGWFKGATG